MAFFNSGVALVAKLLSIDSKLILTKIIFAYSSAYYLVVTGRYVYFLFQYVPVFLWEMLKANIDVAYRVVHPRLPINPGIVKVRTSLQSDIAITLLANSITLTPGTMSVDVDKDSALLYVHWIDVRSPDMESATLIIVDRFERILRKIFEEGTSDEVN